MWCDEKFAFLCSLHTSPLLRVWGNLVFCWQGCFIFIHVDVVYCKYCKHWFWDFADKSAAIAIRRPLGGQTFSSQSASKSKLASPLPSYLGHKIEKGLRAVYYRLDILYFADECPLLMPRVQCFMITVIIVIFTKIITKIIITTTTANLIWKSPV